MSIDIICICRWTKQNLYIQNQHLFFPTTIIFALIYVCSLDRLPHDMHLYSRCKWKDQSFLSVLSTGHILSPKCAYLSFNIYIIIYIYIFIYICIYTCTQQYVHTIRHPDSAHNYIRDYISCLHSWWGKEIPPPKLSSCPKWKSTGELQKNLLKRKIKQQEFAIKVALHTTGRG